MFQATDLLPTKPFNNLSTFVGSVGNIVPNSQFPTPNPDHLESNVTFKQIETPDSVTRIIVFYGTLIELVDSNNTFSSTREYKVTVNCILKYNYQYSTVPNQIDLQLIVNTINSTTPNTTILPYTPVFNNYDFSYDFFAIIGFTCGNSTIKANLRLGKSPSEGIVNGSFLIPVEFYLVKPYLGKFRFQESSYSVYDTSDGLFEITQLVGVLKIPNVGDYNIVLDSARRFLDSARIDLLSSENPQSKSIESKISIRDLDNSQFSVGISSEKFQNNLSEDFYIMKFVGNNNRNIFITGSFVIPGSRKWNSKPRDLTLNYLNSS